VEVLGEPGGGRARVLGGEVGAGIKGPNAPRAFGLQPVDGALDGLEPDGGLVRTEHVDALTGDLVEDGLKPIAEIARCGLIARFGTHVPMIERLGRGCLRSL
jgi:hypothetical protein